LAHDHPATAAALLLELGDAEPAEGEVVQDPARIATKVSPRRYSCEPSASASGSSDE
jgi:hypothetical protein